MESYRGKYSTIFEQARYCKRTFYENLLHEIDELFDKSTFTDNSRLEGLYLLGFHNQAYDLKLKKEKSEEKEESSEE